MRIRGALQTRHIVGLANSAEEDRLELVHPSIGKEKRSVIVRDDGGGGNCRYALVVASRDNRI